MPTISMAAVIVPASCAAAAPAIATVLRPPLRRLQCNPSPSPSLSLKTSICPAGSVAPLARRCSFTVLRSSSSDSSAMHIYSTGTLSCLLAAAAVRIAVAKAVGIALSTNLRPLAGSLAPAAGSLFFAAIGDRPSGYINMPLAVVASGMAKWLDIYSGVLMVRVLLSWFPNMPWDRQPLSAIRDLCDPYLNLFRNIIPPVFGALDISPLLAFAVLGTLGSILNNRGM